MHGCFPLLLRDGADSGVEFCPGALGDAEENAVHFLADVAYGELAVFHVLFSLFVLFVCCLCLSCDANIVRRFSQDSEKNSKKVILWRKPRINGLFRMVLVAPVPPGGYFCLFR